MNDIDKAVIDTFTGRRFHILDPQPEEICMTDIAHALSNQCRYTGHVREFYSVAQHSVYASMLVPPVDALWGLLHDAAEAYISDLNRPAKYYTPIGPLFKEVETRILAAIAGRFKLNLPEPESVKKADRRLMHTERSQLLGRDDNKWGTPEYLDMTIRPMLPKEAEQLFRIQFFNAGGVDE